MALIYISKGGKQVICPDGPCSNCEHAEPHEFETVDSTCYGGGDHNCPECEVIEVREIEQSEDYKA